MLSDDNAVGLACALFASLFVELRALPVALATPTSTSAHTPISVSRRGGGADGDVDSALDDHCAFTACIVVCV
jgi:hypothetical protein